MKNTKVLPKHNHFKPKNKNQLKANRGKISKNMIFT